MSKKSWLVSVLVVSVGLVGVVACSDDSAPKKECGNGVCGPDETADTCPVDCGCGNGLVNEGEECDGDDLADQTCQSLGYQAGVLACSNRCTFDRSRCQGGAVCGNGLLEGGEECDGTDKGDKTCQDFGYDGGELGCDLSCHMETTSCCTNSCDQEGATRCTGQVLEACSVAATGCLAWQQTEDCARRQGTCAEGDDGFYCKYPCRDRCTEQGSHLCDMDVLKVCDKTDPNDPEACLDWLVEQDCAANDQYCGDRGDGPTCITPPPGDTCLQPYEVTQLPFHLAGNDITQDYTNQYDFSGTGCSSGNGVEAIFAVQLQAGDNLHVVEDGSLDAVIRILDTCDATAECLLSKDYPEDNLFEVPTDGTYYVVLEAWSSSPTSKAYDLTIEVLPPETDCSDGLDNDLDGATDCEDLNCAGVSPCERPEQTCDDSFDNDADGATDCADADCFGQTGCTTETICSDGQDNDADGATDCADSDCAGVSPCESTETTCNDGFDNDGDGLIDCSDPDCPVTSCLRAVYEEFTDDNPIDLQTWHLTFTPDANLRMGYQWTATADGTPFPNVPGSGDVSQTLTMTDDDSQAYQFSRMASFTFYDQTYQTVYVISNGFVTFENPTSTLAYSLTEFLAEVPKIAAIDRDFSPQNGGTITVDEFTDRWVVTFENVPRFLHNDETVTFQIVLHDDGSIDIYYGAILLTDNGAFSGITDGNSSSSQFPGVTNFVP